MTLKNKEYLVELEERVGPVLTVGAVDLFRRSLHQFSFVKTPTELLRPMVYHVKDIGTSFIRVFDYP